eukprot:331762_1
MDKCDFCGYYQMPQIIGGITHHPLMESINGKLKCPSCRDAEQRREREAKAARLESAHTKPGYCPEYYSFSCNNWADVDYSIDSYNFVWTKCIINCKAKRHSIYYQPNFNNSSHLSASYYHLEITNKLSLSECPDCKKENAKVAAFNTSCKSAQNKINNLSTELTNIENMLNQFTSHKTETESKTDASTATNLQSIKQIEQKEKDILKSILSFQSVKDQISTTQQQNNTVIENIQATQTYTSESELDASIQKLQNILQKCAESKEILHTQIEDANNREAELLEQQNKTNDEIKQKLKDQNELNDMNKRIDDQKAKLSGFSGSEINAKGDDIQALNQRFDKLLISIRGKYKDNKQRIDELNDCQKRMRKIRAKIKKEKSDCKYLIQLIEEECERISAATDEAMNKFEERTNYFLSVTVGLKQDIVEKLIDFDLEDIVDLKEDDLINDYNMDKASRSKLLRCIKKINNKLVFVFGESIQN